MLLHIKVKEDFMYRMKYRWTPVLVLIVTVMIVVAWQMRSSPSKTQAQQTATDRKTAPQKWEVHVIVVGTAPAVAKEANTLGDQGWELVSVVVGAPEGSPFRYEAYFKRPKL